MPTGWMYCSGTCCVPGPPMAPGVNQGGRRGVTKAAGKPRRKR